ncbi:Rid family detoxifying hydrolase [Haloplanus halobius]|uniref:Rid family detoxifying hydrolase n=1 Tax=Haloplanus halobius TaxID=2934938 RepID=UPI0020106206|nr:Rid family detoxifying hydrolase [Haloplanus sp. XH21]
MEEIKTELAPLLDYPFSQAIAHDGALYVSGQVPIDPETGSVVSDDIREQTKQTLDNLDRILQAAGTSFDNVLKATVYLDDIDDFATVNETYSEYVSEPFPARSAFEVGELADVFEIDLLVEIDAIVVL